MLVSIIKNTLLRFNLPLSKARGHCYDGASNMSGIRNGVATQLCKEEPRAVYSYGHSLNLAAADAIKNSKLMKSALDTTHEIAKLIKYSLRRDALFETLKSELAPDSPGIRVLCPTRWTVRADSLASILSNYTALQELWEKCVEIVKDSETIAQINGVASQMSTFTFLFGVELGETILRNTDNLSKTLQHRVFSASEGQEVAQMIVKTLEPVQNEESFNLFWEKVEVHRAAFEVDEPILPRKRKCPQRFDDGTAVGDHPATPNILFRQHYFEALDLIINCIESRFEQPGYNTYKNLQELLFQAIKGHDFEPELQYISRFYKAKLKCQLQTFALDYPIKNTQPNVFEIREYMSNLSPAKKQLIAEVCTIMKLILVMPATNATSERSFSALKRPSLHHESGQVKSPYDLTCTQRT